MTAHRITGAASRFASTQSQSSETCRSMCAYPSASSLCPCSVHRTARCGLAQAKSLLERGAVRNWVGQHLLARAIFRSLRRPPCSKRRAGSQHAVLVLSKGKYYCCAASHIGRSPSCSEQRESRRSSRLRLISCSPSWKQRRFWSSHGQPLNSLSEDASSSAMR